MSQQTLDLVQRWLDEIVIDLNLCPFAARPRRQDKIRIALCPSDDIAAIMTVLASEIEHLNANTATETTLLVLENGFDDFIDYLDLAAECEDWLADEGYEGIYQIASFHPAYQFAGTLVQDRENFTNRAPYPILHLLREAELTRVIDQYPDTDSIPQRNIDLLNNMPADEFEQRFCPFIHTKKPGN